MQVGDRVIIYNYGTYDQGTVTRIGKTFGVEVQWGRRDRLDPRAIRPFDEEVWAEIKRLGQEIATAQDRERELQGQRRAVFDGRTA